MISVAERDIVMVGNVVWNCSAIGNALGFEPKSSG
jgi:hypothetical protein